MRFEEQLPTTDTPIGQVCARRSLAGHSGERLPLIVVAYDPAAASKLRGWARSRARVTLALSRPDHTLIFESIDWIRFESSESGEESAFELIATIYVNPFDGRKHWPALRKARAEEEERAASRKLYAFNATIVAPPAPARRGRKRRRFQPGSAAPAPSNRPRKRPRRRPPR